MRSPRLVLATRIALLAAAYVALAKVGLLVATVGRSVTLVWPPTGLAIASLMLGTRSLWPGVALGAFVANVTTPGVGLPTAAAIAAGNTLEAVVGVTLLQRARFRCQLDRVRDVIRYLTLGAMVGPAVSATVGTVALLASGHVARAALFETWRVWWVGDLMGALLVGPAVLTWSSPADEPESRSRWEAVALVVALAAAAAAGLTEPQTTRPYIIFPGVIWAALRFGPPGAAAATLLVSTITVGSTVSGYGAFAGSSLGEDLMALHAFIVCVAGTGLVLGAVAAERVRAIRERENFISIASHELRSPLAPIRLQVQRLLRGLRLRPETTSPEMIREALEVIDRQVERLTALLENVLDLTRLRLSRLPLAPEAVDLGALVDEIAASLRDQLAQAGCTLRLDRTGPVTGTWDRARLAQVLTNLLVNAMKHGGSGPIDVALMGKDREVTIVVRDHGPGVPKEDAERVFRRFERAGAQGLGLGLYISREIVQAHGGELRVESPNGGGAAFRIELPTEPVSRR
jgi:signal transduction histidine kinase